MNTRRFFQSCNEIIYGLYLDNNIDTIYICYEIIAKMILKIRITNKKCSNYIDFISAVKNIQKYVVRVFLNSKYVFLIFYKIRGYAKYIGDIRTIYYVDLLLGAYNAVSNNYKGVLKKHEAMKAGVDGIFELGDDDLVLQSADLIALYYMLNGEYLKNMSFYSSIAHKFSKSQEDHSILLRVIFISFICLVNTTMYRKARVFILDAIKYLEGATLFEKKLIYASLGYIYTLMKKDNEASEVFFKLYDIKSYRKSFAHSFFISTFVYFICREKKNDPYYKEILNKIMDINKIKEAYIFMPCWSELVMSDGMRAKLGVDVNHVVEQIEYDMQVPFPAVRAMLMHSYGVILFNVFNKIKEAERYLKESAEICKELSYYSEYTKVCLSIADIYERNNDRKCMIYYLNCAWYHYIRTHQPDWPEKYSYIKLDETYKSQMSIAFTRKFFINLGYQNFFGYNQNIFTKILRAMILTFPLEKGIFIRYDDKDCPYVEACEDIDYVNFISEKFEHAKDLHDALNNNKYIVSSISKNKYEAYISDMDIYFFILFCIGNEKYIIY